jgi:hypothetical protein
MFADGKHTSLLSPSQIFHKHDKAIGILCILVESTLAYCVQVKYSIKKFKALGILCILVKSTLAYCVQVKYSINI